MPVNGCPANPLAGYSVLVTRPLGQGIELCQAIQTRGGRAVMCPLQDIVPPADAAAIGRVWDAVQPDWLVFVSVNAVAGLQQLTGQLTKPGVRIAAVGAATARALAARGAAVDLCPSAGFNSEALLASAVWHAVAGHRMLIIRGQGGRELLAEQLSARGAQVEYLEVYRRVCAQRSVQVCGWLHTRLNKLLVLTSVEAFRCLQNCYNTPQLAELRLLPVATLSTRIAAAIRASGHLGSVRAALEPSDAGLLGALETIAAELRIDHAGT